MYFQHPYRGVCVKAIRYNAAQKSRAKVVDRGTRLLSRYLDPHASVVTYTRVEDLYSRPFPFDGNRGPWDITVPKMQFLYLFPSTMVNFSPASMSKGCFVGFQLLVGDVKVFNHRLSSKA